MTVEVVNNESSSRYEILVEGVLGGIAEYRPDGDALVFPHTVIEPSRRGQGLGDQLIQGALDDVRRRGATVVPLCWFVAQFIDEHPAYADLLATGGR